MEHMKTPKSLIMLLAILALVGAVAIAGCGGGSSSSSAETTTEEPAEEAPAEETEAGEEVGGGETVAVGEKVFSTNCASCHTLAADEAKGTVGPNLDELKPSAATVEHQVINGGGPMPAFGKEGTLNEEEIKAVSTYVSTVAGQ
jgi:mono/diheme cytochrome c family protein